MMKRLLTCLLLGIMCIATTACISTFGMEEQNGDYEAVSLNIGDYVLLGKYKEEPILWRCVDIDENGMLMLSDKILCDKIFGSSTFWRDSFLRKWLNSIVPESAVEWDLGSFLGKPVIRSYIREKGFLNDNNFSQSERDVMKTVTQWTMLPKDHLDLAENGETTAYTGIEKKGSDDPFGEGGYYYSISDFPNVFHGAAHRVEDTVFLLDEMQIYHIWSNFGTVSDDWRPPSLYPAGDSYFLRTPSGEVCSEISGGGYSSTSAGLDSGIRPAFYLNETSAQILSGSGTEEDPYVINGKKNDNIHVYCDWRELKFDVQPVNENGRVLVPMRKLFETLGAEIGWDEATRTVTAVKDQITVSLQIDQREMYVNGEMIWLDVPPKIVDNRTLIPLRAISEALGANVEWTESSRRVDITT